MTKILVHPTHMDNNINNVVQHHTFLWSLTTNLTVKRKLAVKTSGPFTIVHVHINGTITIQLRLSVTEHINLCCTIPYDESLI